MAYTAFDFQVVVTGHLVGGETWTNTWTFDTMGGLGNRQDAADALNQFYTDLKGYWTTLQGADSAAFVDLSDGFSIPATWTPVIGTAGSSALPQEVASRLSLDDGQGHRGGPFLPPPTTAGLASTGLMTTTYQDAIADAAVALNANALADDIDLRLDRPSVPSTVPVFRIRVGIVFDVIRSRRNALSESYDIRTV